MARQTDPVTGPWFALQRQLARYLIEPDLTGSRTELLAALEPDDFSNGPHGPMQSMFHAAADLTDDYPQWEAADLAIAMAAHVGPDALTVIDDLFRTEIPPLTDAHAHRLVADMIGIRKRRRMTAQLADVALRATQDGIDDPHALAEQLARTFDTILDDGLDRWTVYERPWDIQGQARTDWVLHELLLPGEVLMATASGGAGKALPLDTPIFTTDGWTTIGEIRPGAVVFDDRGRQVRVLACSEGWKNRPCYRITTASGRTLVADVEHLWRIGTRPNPKTAYTFTTVTTRDVRIGDVIEIGHGAFNADVPLPVEPYTLGVWLGDGSSYRSDLCLNDADADSICAGIEADGYTVVRKHYPDGRRAEDVKLRLAPSHSKQILDTLGLITDKHIPPVYLAAGWRQRVELLRGLIDTDGHAKDGKVEWCTTIERLAADVTRLVRSLGIKAQCKLSDAKLNGRVVGPRWRLRFTQPMHLPTLAKTPRRAEQLIPSWQPQTRMEKITEVAFVGDRDTKCIQVEGGMFVAGHDFVPTHNSELLRQLAMCCVNSIDPFLGYWREGSGGEALVFDTETQPHNVKESLIRQGVALHKRGQFPIDDIRYPKVVSLRQRLNLRGGSDLAELRRIVGRIRPRLICIGPLKNLYSERDGESYSNAALELQDVCMRLMEDFDCALAIEAHGTKADAGSTAGSQRWNDWPDIAFGIERIADDEIRKAFTSKEGADSLMQFLSANRGNPTVDAIRLTARRGNRNSLAHYPRVLVRDPSNVLSWTAWYEKASPFRQSTSPGQADPSDPGPPPPPPDDELF